MNDSQNKTWYQRNWRWFVLGTLFLATFLNYFDRQTLGAAMSKISVDFKLDNVQIGKLLSAFLLTYAICHLFIGIVLDKAKNIRLFFPIMVIGWSVTTILAGLAKNYEQLKAMRYLLGVWEAVNFPICIMIIARIFPAKERSLASGIFASGAFLATLIAPKVTIYFANEYTWRYSFIFAGALGVIWLIPWLLIFKNPSKFSDTWDTYQTNKDNKKNAIDFEALSKILKSPAFWGVACIGLGIIPSLYFSTQWLPTFLEKSIGLAYDQKLGNYLMGIYLFQDLGLWIGGAIVLGLMSSNIHLIKARKIIMLIGCIMMISILFLIGISQPIVAVIILSIFTFGIGMFLGNQHAFKQDVLKGNAATVAAWVGFIEMMFTHFVIEEIGIITKDSNDYTVVFIGLAGLSIFGLVMGFLLLRKKSLDIQ